MDKSDTITELAKALAKAQGIDTIASEWKLVPGFTSYAVHPLGLLFSSRGNRPSLLRGMVSGRGYLAVSLKSDAGTLERNYIHRIIASVFLPVDSARTHVNHKDGNKRNNAAANLEWCTSAENLKHARTTGLSNMTGENNPATKYTPRQVNLIRSLRDQGYSYSTISKVVGCSIMQANRIARGLLRKDG